MPTTRSISLNQILASSAQQETQTVIYAQDNRYWHHAVTKVADEMRENASQTRMFAQKFQKLSVMAIDWQFQSNENCP